MARLRTNNVFGTTTNNPLAIGGLTLNSAGLADLAAVAGGNEALITLDPDRINGAPEIVRVTAHTGAATSATITRGQFGTSARAHPVNTRWVCGPVGDGGTHIGDFRERHGVILRRAATQSIPDATTTAISWDTEDQDTDGFIAVTGTTVTVPTGLAGLYSISLLVDFTSGASARTFIEVSAAGRVWRSALDASADEDQGHVGIVVALADAQNVQCNAFIDTAGAADTVVARLEMFRIGD